MNSNRSEGSWKRIADNVKRRLGKVVGQQVDLWSGKRDRAKRAAEGQALQQQSEPLK